MAFNCLDVFASYGLIEEYPVLLLVLLFSTLSVGKSEVCAGTARNDRFSAVLIVSCVNLTF